MRSGRKFSGAWSGTSWFVPAVLLLLVGCRSEPVTILLFPDGGPVQTDGGVVDDHDLAPPEPPHWRWESPRPQGNNLRAVFVAPGATAAADEVYITGDSGTLFHQAGGVWDQVDVSGLLGFNGSTLLALQGSGPDDLLAVGVYDAVLARRLGQWGVQDPIRSGFGDGLLTAVWASGAQGESYVVGTTGRIYHVHGAWTQEATGLSSVYLGGVSGSGTGDAQEVFAVGAVGTVLHRKGGTWTMEAAGLSTQQLNAAAALPGGECYAVGQNGTVLHRQKDMWAAETVPTTAALYGVWASGEQIFAVGGKGTVLRRKSGTWVVDADGVTGELLSAVYGVMHGGQATVYAVGNLGTLLRRDQTGWTSLAPTLSENPLSSVWARGANEIYAVGGGGVILRRTGTAGQGTWTPEGAGATTESLNAVSGWAPSPPGEAEVYAVGTTGTILHRSAGTWNVEGAVLTGEDFSAVWVGADAVYAVGGNGRIGRKDDDQGQWSLDKGLPSMAGDLSAVWGTGHGADRVVYIGTRTGGIFRLAQGVWVKEGQGLTTEALTGMFGTGPDEVYALGPKGQALHRLGGRWFVEPLNLRTKAARGVVGCTVPGSDRLYGLSSQGDILLRAGTSWGRDGTPLTGQQLMGISAVGVDDVYAVGIGGIVLHRF